MSIRPPQYYDLATDPLEKNNLAQSGEHHKAVSERLAEVEEKYDDATLSEKVLESQRRRNFLKNVMRDPPVTWDYQPIKPAQEAYIRNTIPIYQLEKNARFLPV